jgi:hypothetical protein
MDTDTIHYSRAIARDYNHMTDTHYPCEISHERYPARDTFSMSDRSDRSTRASGDDDDDDIDGLKHIAREVNNTHHILRSAPAAATTEDARRVDLAATADRACATGWDIIIRDIGCCVVLCCVCV